jgi:hypothetical protein
LEKRAEKVLPESEGGGTMYTQMNKKMKNSKNNRFKLLFNYISLLKSKD